ECRANEPLVYGRRRDTLFGRRGDAGIRFFGRLLLGLGRLLVAGLCMSRRHDEQKRTGDKGGPAISRHDSRSFELVPTASMCELDTDARKRQLFCPPSLIQLRMSCWSLAVRG